MRFDIINSDITNISAEAVVLPANTELREGRGVSEALFEAAGRNKLTEACRQIGHCDLGYAVATQAFDLDARVIIHAVVPKWIDGNHNEYELLSSSYLSALGLADYLECESIAFPLLASGNNGFDLELALEIAKESIELFEGKNLKKVSLVIKGGRISSLVLNKGMSYSENPIDIKQCQEERLRQERYEQIKKEVQNVAAAAAVIVIDMAKAYWKDPKNREFVKDTGVKIAKTAFSKILK